MELLKDPLGDRQIKSVKLPPAKPLLTEKMYPDPGKSSASSPLQPTQPCLTWSSSANGYWMKGASQSQTWCD